MRRIVDPKAEYMRLAALCSISEQCRFDLMQRLRKRDVGMDIAERILDRLESEGYVNEERYAGAFARDKVRLAGWGRIKVRAMLIGKRISPEAISSALDSVAEDDYRQALSKSVNSLCKGVDMSDLKKRQSVLRSLIARGFTFDEAVRGLKNRDCGDVV